SWPAGGVASPGVGERGAGVPSPNDFGAGFDAVFVQRKKEADEFYATRMPKGLSDDAKVVMRQALGGMLWCKQFYHYDVKHWLEGDPAAPPPPKDRLQGRNRDWVHLYNSDIISMPDKWEYPWYAAWDLAFHCVALALIDPDFAKEQLVLMLREWYMHPNGQLPAYEWAFGDVNPPVHAWAAWRVYKIEKRIRGKADRAFLERVFQKLMLNFTWWVNRKDAEGRNVFQDGFFYDALCLPEGSHQMLKARSAVGFIPLFGVETLEPDIVDHLSGFKRRMQWFIDHLPHVRNHIDMTRKGIVGPRRLLAMVNR